MGIICNILTGSVLLAAIHGCSAQHVHARQVANDTNARFHHRAYHNSIVISNDGKPYLYVDGGTVTLWDGRSEDSKHGYADYNTYALPLDSSWTLANAPLQSIGRHTVPLWSYESAALWPSEDGTSFYSYGGHVSGAVHLYGDPNYENILEWFTPNATGGTWDTVAPGSDSSFSELTRTTESLNAYRNGLGFALAGEVDSQTIKDYQDRFNPIGMVIYNVSSQEWRNLTTVGTYSRTGKGSHGAAHFVPSFGDEGLLFVFGGYTNSEPLPLDEIHMFDPVSGQWGMQKATGDIPPEVEKACVVGLLGDNGTYEIFLHGGFSAWYNGWDLDTSIELGSVWSFSLPAFRWQKHNTDPTYSRYRHSCNIAGNRQMLVVGGQVSDKQSTLDVAIHDPWPQGIGVYDLTTLSWKDDGFDANAEPYVTPDVIKASYQANGTFPTEWTEPDVVEGWFTQASRNGTTATPPSNQSDGGSGGGAPAGAIAGGVLGGLAAIGIIAAAVWYLRRRSQSRMPQDQVASDEVGARDYKSVSVEQQRGQEELDGRPRAELHGKQRPVEIGSSQVHER